MTDEERQIRAAEARERFKTATSEIAAEGRFAETEGMTEIEILEYATRLQKLARKK